MSISIQRVFRKGKTNCYSLLDMNMNEGMNECQEGRKEGRTELKDRVMEVKWREESDEDGQKGLML